MASQPVQWMPEGSGWATVTEPPSVPCAGVRPGLAPDPAAGPKGQRPSARRPSQQHRSSVWLDWVRPRGSGAAERCLWSSCWSGTSGPEGTGVASCPAMREHSTGSLSIHAWIQSCVAGHLASSWSSHPWPYTSSSVNPAAHATLSATLSDTRLDLGSGRNSGGTRPSRGRSGAGSSMMAGGSVRVRPRRS
jgi:hypothetical protein